MKEATGFNKDSRAGFQRAVVRCSLSLIVKVGSVYLRKFLKE